MLETILLDSSFVFALFNVDDKNHASADNFVRTSTFAGFVPQVAINEVFFLIDRKGGVPATDLFFRGFLETNFQLVSITLGDLQRVREIRQKYASARLDFVDCCFMALSERLNITKVCTFDRRDFSIFRPQHFDALELLP
jgi:hypothetical protein